MTTALSLAFNTFNLLPIGYGFLFQDRMKILIAIASLIFSHHFPIPIRKLLIADPPEMVWSKTLGLTFPRYIPTKHQKR